MKEYSRKNRRSPRTASVTAVCILLLLIILTSLFSVVRFAFSRFADSFFYPYMHIISPGDRLSDTSLLIEDKSTLQPLDAAIQSNLRQACSSVLATLTPREERVLRMRFGIGMTSDHTLEEVGQQFAVTRERIRQIEAKALRKLKHPSRSKKLRTFLENN